ncbi:MAG: ctaC [Gemmatimonadetes bacterium]|nr:ctaC [Gemmatimonadota bacterium]
MPFPTRPRVPVRAALTALLLLAAVAACSGAAPNSIFHRHSDFNREIDVLWKLLIGLGTAVFIFVEGLLIVTLVKFRKREGQAEPEHVHGNTTLEILWTIIPAVILIVISIPTIRSIFNTQARASADALQVEVIGHQWWWEFKYPQYGVVTANELYLPIGRKVNFTLHTNDVLHSFWIPQLGGKRDLISNRTNYLWFTPDSVGSAAFNGFCAEYCGASHANMRFRTFTVTPAEFAEWTVHQAGAAVGTTVATATVATPTLATPADSNRPKHVPGGGKGDSAQVAMNAPAVTTPATAPAATPAGFTGYPISRVATSNVIPTTPLPAEIAFTDPYGNPARGATLFAQGQGGCIGCHAIKGVPSAMGNIGPNLTHVGSRLTLAAGLYAMDAKHLARWIKNAPVMKPGVIMPTLGVGQYNPVTKSKMTVGLDDQQIADIVAYLLTLK